MTDYVSIPALAHGPRQQQINRIVIHGTVSACKPGGARANARWFQNPLANVSAHFVVDPGEVVRCLPDDVVGWHAPPNTGSIGVELCDMQEGPASRWLDEPHQRMLLRAAMLVAGLCDKHGVPKLFVDSIGLVVGRRGITTHAEVSRAWRKSTHTDPGKDFPLDAFLELVNRVTLPVDNPVQPSQEDDMTPEQDQRLKNIEAMLNALVAPRREDHTDPDTQHISLGDVLNAEQP